MNFVALDLGASGTRYTSKTKQIETLPNQMVFIEKMDFSTGEKTPDLTPIVLRNGDNTVEGNLEVIIKRLDREDPRYPIHALIGDIAKGHSAQTMSPHANVHKYKQTINYVSALTATALHTLQYQLGSEIELYVVFPPMELVNHRDDFANEIKGEYEVTFPRLNGGITCPLKIVNVTSYEESAMAISSFFFDMNTMKMREETAEYHPYTLLSIDIGASTTDLAIVERGTYLPKSGKTCYLGGNDVRTTVKKLLNENDIRLSDSDANFAMIEGRRHFGAELIPISNEMNQAKYEIASRIVADVTEYFKNIDINLEDIYAIVVSGGGSMASKYIDPNTGEEVQTSNPMCDFITMALNRVCPGVKVVNHPLDNPRYANIQGLYIRAVYDVLSRKQAAAAAASASQQPQIGQPQIGPATPQPQTQPQATQPQASPAGQPQAVNQ